MKIEEKFNKDLGWLMSELKQEEMANAYSEYKIKFRLIYPADDSEPTMRSQRRLLKMLEDRKALSLSPFYHGTMRMFDSVFEMQGANPIGYSLQILQPHFDEVLEELTKEKPLKVEARVAKVEALPSSGSDANRYFISISATRKVLLNNTFILSSPNFDTENHQFIEYILEHPDKTLSKKDIETDANIKLKKTIHSILGDLGFKGEVRKLFFEASKSKVKFKNNIKESDLKELEIDIEKLNMELSGLERNDKKPEEEKGNEEKETE